MFKNETTATMLDFAGWQALGLDPAGTFGVDPGWADPADGDFS